MDAAIGRKNWSIIIELYQDLKHVTLLTEEFDPDVFKNYLQPVMEQRSALDHICRAMSIEVGMQEESSAGDYASGNFDKAIGHLYRAFYDAADMLSMALRDKFLDVLESYNTACIVAVCPNYYTELRPRLQEISEEIASARNSKDIKVDEAIESVKHYGGLLDELRAMYKDLLTKVPSLQEYASKQTQSRLFKWLGALALVVIGAIVGYLLKGS